MRNARLLPAGRSIAAFATAISVLVSGAAAANAVEALTSTFETADQRHALSETLTLSSSGGGSFHFRHAEKCFMRRINRFRSRHGLGKLAWDKHLGVVGRKHARNLARSGGVWHDDIGSKVTRWRSLGQNTGKGPGCKKLTRAFLHSAGHRSNYMGSWRHVGVGVKRANGSMYVQQVFESRRDPGNIWNKP